MKSEWYNQLRKRLTKVFMLMMILVTLIVFIGISIFSTRAGHLANLGMLSEYDLYYFYLSHSWEINVMIFSLSYILLLLFFVSGFFKAMDVLLMCIQKQKMKRKPLFFYFVPQFEMALANVEELQDRKEKSEVNMKIQREHKNELLMYLAHDLKTPLTSIIGYLNHILDHGLTNEDEDKAIAITNDKAKRLNQLIDEFSTIIRYDDKVSHMELVRVDLNSMITKQAKDFYPLLEEKGLQLILDIEKNLWIMADYDKLQRVFDNLMRNAINYANKNTLVKIHMHKVDQMIKMEYCNETEEINAEGIEHLFDKFYRGNSARSSKSGGSGLGLSIAKEIITLHHGDISARLEGHMIIFTIHLPQEVGL